MDPITYEIRLHIHVVLVVAAWNFLSRINSLAANLVVCRAPHSWQKNGKLVL